MYGYIICNVRDPDPYVFGPPGSGSVIQRYGSGSFYHHAKIVITLISNPLKKLLKNAHTKSYKQNKFDEHE
jgi:hypothetical protein